MQVHEVTLLDGTKLYGLIGFIDHYEDKFYLLDQYTVGMIGQKGVGREIGFDECESVYALRQSADGQVSKDTNEQISAWRTWRKMNLKR
jgi:hypothetical protein